ncbi:hypothetical protein [Carboxylicivirga linearis]|uniref:Cytochrome B n=1 Tax=Carboxylicivirga linearis TaxID=1628157 RepID=A0ABS5JQ93_9BACT|nr:hypothetical protein [Carboxylicivirga linearis]MBS2097041.1 hypothetical protein [Carboxylicivirga linearis]
MYTGLLHAHSGLRYIVIILLLAVIIQSLIGWIGRTKFSNIHKKVAIASMSLVHIQFLIGAVLFFISPKVVFDPSLFGGAIIRFFTLEHPLLMMVAIAVITIGQIKSKSYTNYKSHKRLFWANLIGFLLIMASIPWPFREQLGSGWF